MTTHFQTISGSIAPSRSRSPPETENGRHTNAHMKGGVVHRASPPEPRTKNGSAAKEPFQADIVYDSTSPGRLGPPDAADANREVPPLPPLQQPMKEQTTGGGPQTRPASQTRVRVAMPSVDRPLSPLPPSHDRTPLTGTFQQLSQPTTPTADNGVYILKSSFYSGFL